MVALLHQDNERAQSAFRSADGEISLMQISVFHCRGNHRSVSLFGYHWNKGD